jgi:hypothetical protein
MPAVDFTAETQRIAEKGQEIGSQSSPGHGALWRLGGPLRLCVSALKTTAGSAANYNRNETPPENSHISSLPLAFSSLKGLPMLYCRTSRRMPQFSLTFTLIPAP